MFLLSLLVFINLFLIPILFHPFNICRHFIHIGYEPFPAKSLSINSYELYLHNFIEYPKTYISPSIKHKNLFEKFWKYIFKRNNHFSKRKYYPNLIKYTQMYIDNNDLSPFIYSFFSMYISYFLLIYFSSLVHVYRIKFTSKEKSINDIRYRTKQLIESSYIRWIIHTLFWKFIAVIISHIFYIMAVKILMQRLFISYEHIHIKQDSMYSSWNFYKNIQIIYKYEGGKAFFSGILSRMIYEFGKFIIIYNHFIRYVTI